ncbi:MAG: hypothetical protein ACKVY0_29420 [Prosthecobacter sp.]|uniref:hypothetical protein n=1 Tax=Prosthecobacter sp. TaxID=1965333 RepID=UPI0039001362
MKTLLGFKYGSMLAGCCSLLLLSSAASGQTPLPAPMRPEVQALLDAYQTDAPWADVNAWTKAQQELTTRPDIKPDLLRQLQREYFIAKQTPGASISFSALGALALRKDLNPAEQKIIADELERLVSAGDNKYFVNGGINLLSHYPTPEHEDLVLRFLERDDRQVHTLLSAFRTLSAIGGGKSLETMRQMAARLQAKNQEYWFLKELNGHVTALETRLKQEAATGRTQAATASLPTPKPAPSTTTTVSPEPPVSTTDWRMWLGLLGGLILVIALACRAFRKR